ncbi:acyltransferase [Paenibacillus sp. P96]|uniref:Acyltransferase n=1 Tax=Paenibacillus zeirhizosphaerae TaxID=2987519 RepID=A0ABT9FWD7_9BACL|nr:acyltransferase [Paenibacillus sp. P96]MDP4099023.1 acyltransferase [Paenibacillus sp. P96]
MEKTFRRPRIDEWTELRGLAFLAIVLQHSIGEYIYRPDIQSPDSVMLGIIYHLTRFGTPTFVFLSAALLFYNYKYRRAAANAHWLGKRFGDIYIPFIFWAVVYWIVARSWSKIPLTGPGWWQSLLREMIIPLSGYHLWFVVMIFQFYVLFPLFGPAWNAIKPFFLKDNGTGNGVRTAIMLSVLGVLYTVLMHWSYYDMSGWLQGLPRPLQFLVEHRTYIFVMYFFYFVLGAVCASMVGSWRLFVQRSLPWNAIIFLFLFTMMGYTLLRQSGETINLNISTYLKPSTFLLIVSQMLLLYGLLLRPHANAAPGRFRRMLAWMGKYSFGAYLCHALLLYGVAYFTRSLPLQNLHLAVAVGSFVIVACTALGVSRLLSALPGGHWIIGASGRRSRHKGPADRQEFQIFAGKNRP